jgi:hypothetical protein
VSVFYLSFAKGECLMLGDTEKTNRPENARLLIRVKEIVRAFFLGQFSESPRLLTLELVGNSIHVHGYRSLTPAEVKAMADKSSFEQMERYHQALVSSAQSTLKEKLQSELHRKVTSVEWFLDMVHHEFDIVITLNANTNHDARRPLMRATTSFEQTSHNNRRKTHQ